MDNRQRTLRVLRHEQPDRVPYMIEFTEKAAQGLREYYGCNDCLSQIDNCLHEVQARPGPKEQWLDVFHWQDEFGVRWDRTADRDIGVICNCLLPDRNLDKLELPNPYDKAKFDEFGERCAAGNGRCVCFSIGFSLFERAWTLRGMENLMIDMLEAPEFVDELLDGICDYNIALIEQALHYDIDIVHFGDDWGSQRGLLISGKLWERFLMPRLARQYGVAKEAGKFVSIHSCGKVQEVFPQLIEIGLDCFNPFQPEVMDVYEMKRLYGDHLSFYGGISTQRLLPYGTPEEVKAEARRLKTKIGRQGGYILAPAHAIPGDARPENILALVEIANES